MSNEPTLGPVVPGRAYRLRNGTSVYCFGLHSCNPEIALTWGGSEGYKGSPICYHHERATGRNHSYLGYGERAQRLDIVGHDVVAEEMIADDLRAAWERHEQADEERRARVQREIEEAA